MRRTSKRRTSRNAKPRRKSTRRVSRNPPKQAWLVMVEGKYLKSYDYHPSIGVAGTALTKSAREAMTFTHALAKSVASSISADEGPETRVVQRGELGRNPPPQLYRAIGVDSSGQRRPIGTGPVGAMRETAMASWLGDPSMRSAYVVDRLGHSHLTLEPRDRSRLQGNGRVSPEMLKEWDRVNYAVRLAEKSGDYRAAEAAKAEVNRVYRETQNVRLGISPNGGRRRRVSRNTTTSTMREYSAPVDEDFAAREAEAHNLLRYDLTSVLDEAAENIEKAETILDHGAAVTSDLQNAVYMLTTAAMLAEMAYVKNCEDNKTEQCWRSGELINRARDLMPRVISQAVILGIQQKTRDIAETAPPPKKGWFSW